MKSIKSLIIGIILLVYSDSYAQTNNYTNIYKRLNNIDKSLNSMSNDVKSIKTNILHYWNGNTNKNDKLGQIDKIMGNIHYCGIPTMIINTNYDRYGQSPEVTVNRGYGNCLDQSRLVKKLAEDRGLRARYQSEYHHVVTMVTDPYTGKEWRYSNGKRK